MLITLNQTFSSYAIPFSNNFVSYYSIIFLIVSMHFFILMLNEAFRDDFVATTYLIYDSNI